MFNLYALFYTFITILRLQLSSIISELPPLIFSMVENVKFQCRKYWKKLQRRISALSTIPNSVRKRPSFRKSIFCKFIMLFEIVSILPEVMHACMFCIRNCLENQFSVLEI